MLKDESNTQKNNIQPKTPLNQQQQQPLNEIQQQIKDRTLFCINIDSKCTEDILYELFLQVGPIDNIVRKADRNGNLICLITYKHIESCDYAIKIFNGISLFNQSLKVRPSDSSSLANQQQQQQQNNNINRQNSNNNGYHNRAYSSSSSSNRQNLPDQKLISSLPTTPQALMMPPPQQNLANLLSHALNNLSPQIPDHFSGLLNPFQQQLNRSWSGSNINENDFNHQSRRTSYNNNNNNNSFEHNRGSSYNNNNNNRRNDFTNSRGGGGGNFNDFNNSRDYSKQNNNNNFNNKQQDIRRDRSRSRSPIRKRNRR